MKVQSRFGEKLRKHHSSDLQYLAWSTNLQPVTYVFLSGLFHHNLYGRLAKIADSMGVVVCIVRRENIRFVHMLVYTVQNKIPLPKNRPLEVNTVKSKQLPLRFLRQSGQVRATVCGTAFDS